MKKLFKLFLFIISVILMLSMLTACNFLTFFRGLFGNECIVTFDLNGGEAPEGFEASVVVPKGSTVTVLTPTKEGHDFLGWFNGDAKFLSETKVISNTTVTAKWQAHKVTVTFLDYFGDFIEEQVIDYGTAAKPPKVQEKVSDLNFQGWDGDISSVKSDITVMPIYDYSRYTVTFNSSGGSAVPSQTLVFNEIPEIPPAPEKSGRSFEGWYLDKTLSEKYLFNVALNEDITLYAFYINDFTTITTAEELNNIRNKPDGKYILGNDISLGAAKWEPIDNFSGILDGNGNKIYDFVMSGSSELFGFIKTNNGTVKNLNFDEFAFGYSRSNQKTAKAGVIAAVNNGTIKRCRLFSGDIEMSFSISTSESSMVNANAYFGGLVGVNNGTVTECRNALDINCSSFSQEKNLFYGCSTYSHIASAVGYNSGSISKTIVSGNIKYTPKVSVSSDCHASNISRIGGIAGYNTGAEAYIYNCVSQVKIEVVASGSGNSTKSIDTGLLVGYNNSSAKISDCMLVGTIDISNTNQNLSGNIGGAVGTNAGASTITNIFVKTDITTGSAVTTNIGGIVGNNASGTVTNKSVFVGSINAGANVSGLALAFGVQSGSTNLCYYSSASGLIKNGDTATATNSEGISEYPNVILTKEFFFENLSFDSEIWNYEGSKYPTLKYFF